jgi:hypothetical protein
VMNSAMAASANSVGPRSDSAPTTVAQGVFQRPELHGDVETNTRSLAASVSAQTRG